MMYTARHVWDPLSDFGCIMYITSLLISQFTPVRPVLLLPTFTVFYTQFRMKEIYRKNLFQKDDLLKMYMNMYMCIKKGVSIHTHIH